jgi:hypothetical protein
MLESLIRRPALFVIASLTMLSGCQLFHSYKPVTVLVRDAETKEPIAGAGVSVFYNYMLDPFAPSTAPATTGSDGLVHLRVAPYGLLITMRAEAEGYAMQDVLLAAQSICEITSPGKKGQPDFVFDLYSVPRATVDLVVPNDFKGLLSVEMQAIDSDECVAGQRVFSVCVPANGLAVVKGPAQLLLPRFYVLPDFDARFADGTPLHSVPDKTSKGLSWLTCTAKAHFFAVGTQQDADDAKRIIYQKNSDGSLSHDWTKIKAWTEHQEATQQPWNPRDFATSLAIKALVVFDCLP